MKRKRAVHDDIISKEHQKRSRERAEKVNCDVINMLVDILTLLAYKELRYIHTDTMVLMYNHLVSYI